MAEPVSGFCEGPPLVLAGRSSGQLHGLSFAVKDLIDIAGSVTGCGNPDWRRSHAPAAATAPAVLNLLEAGARLVGKTITDELAFSLDGINAHYGTPRNPSCPDRLPGGSSSGSAAVVAAGLADFALGTDTGGSVRMPASFCGLYGFRPTHGRISLDGVMQFAPSYDTIGWFARDPVTLGAVGRVLLGPGQATPIRHLRIATDAFRLAEPRTRSALLEIATRLGPVDEIALFAGEDEAWRDCYVTLQGAEVWRGLGPWIEATRPRFGPAIAERFVATARITPDEVVRFQPVRQRIAERLRGLLPPGTAVILPTGPSPALLRSAGEADFAAFYGAALTLTSCAGHAGLPQISLPAARIGSCPVGLSLIAAPGEDEALLRWAEEDWATTGLATGEVGC
jgi:amidase